MGLVTLVEGMAAVGWVDGWMDGWLGGLSSCAQAARRCRDVVYFNNYTFVRTYAYVYTERVRVSQHAQDLCSS